MQDKPKLKVKFENTIMFRPSFVDTFGSIYKALYIQQLLYWAPKGKREDGFFYKTKEQLEKETKLTRKQQDKCRKYFEEEGILETKLIKAKGIPTLHYKVDFRLVQKVLTEQDKKDYPVSPKGTNPILTEPTTEPTNTSSKEEGTAPKEQGSPSKSKFVMECISTWNSISHVTRKVNTKKRTKVIQRIEKYIKQLLKGDYFSKREFDKDWFKKNKIPLTGKLSKEDVIKGIHRVSLYQREGYFGSKITKCLADLLYNPDKQISWFLNAFHNKPSYTSDRIKLQDDNPEVSEYIISQLNGEYNAKKLKDRKKLIECSQSFKRFCDNIPEETLECDKIDVEIGLPLDLCREYVYWLGHQDWLEGPSLGIMNTTNEAFKNFVKDKQQNEYAGYKLQ